MAQGAPFGCRRKRFDRYLYEQHVLQFLHASNDLRRAQAVFAGETKRWPRGRYTLRQNIRVLKRWPPHGA
jgi:hypothetical protein